MSRRARLETLWAGVAWLTLLAPRAAAHDGPPYPILVDEVVAGWTLSVWADPDVGTGTFYYYVAPPEGRGALDVRIEAISVPEEPRSPPAAGLSEPADARDPYQQIGTLQFGHRGRWPTRFVVHPNGSDSVLGELAFDLDVTPPGLGPLDILLYGFPFLIIGGLWMRVLLAQRAYDRAHSAAPRPAAGDHASELP